MMRFLSILLASSLASWAYAPREVGVDVPDNPSGNGYYGRYVAAGSGWTASASGMSRPDGSRYIGIRVLNQSGQLTREIELPFQDPGYLSNNAVLGLVGAGKLVGIHVTGLIGATLLIVFDTDTGIEQWRHSFPGEFVNLIGSTNWIYAGLYDATVNGLSQTGKIEILAAANGNLETTLTAPVIVQAQRFGKYMVCTDNHLVVADHKPLQKSLIIYQPPSWATPSTPNASLFEFIWLPIAISGSTCIYQDNHSSFATMDLTTQLETLNVISTSPTRPVTASADYFIIGDSQANIESFDVSTFAPGPQFSVWESSGTKTLSLAAHENFLIAGLREYSAPVKNAGGAFLYDLNPLHPLLDLTLLPCHERNRSMTGVLSLEAAAADPVSVTLSTSDGSALSPADYLELDSHTFQIPTGQTELQFQIPIISDYEVEHPESFIVTIDDIQFAFPASSTASGVILAGGFPYLGSLTHSSVPPALLSDWISANGSPYRATMEAPANSKFLIRIYSRLTGTEIWSFQTDERSGKFFSPFEIPTADDYLVIPVPSPKQDSAFPVANGRVHLFDIPSQSNLHTFALESPTYLDRFGMNVAIEPPFILIGAESGNKGFDAFRLDTFARLFHRTFSTGPTETKNMLLKDGIAVLPALNSPSQNDHLEVHNLNTGAPPITCLEPVRHTQTRIGRGMDLKDGVLWTSITESGGSIASYDLSDGNIIQSVQTRPLATSEVTPINLHLVGRFVFYPIQYPTPPFDTDMDYVRIVDAITGALIMDIPAPDEFGGPLEWQKFGTHMLHSDDALFISGADGTYYAYSLQSLLPQLDLLTSELHEGDPLPQLQFSLSEATDVDIIVDAVATPGTAQAGTDYPAALPSLTIPARTHSGFLPFPLIDDSTPELLENFTLQLSSGGSQLTEAELNILDDDGLTSSTALYGPNIIFDDGFGFSFAVSDSLVAAGQIRDGGVDENGTVSTYNKATGAFIDYRISPDDDDSDFFGASVDLHNDWIAVGQPGNPFATDQKGRTYILRASDLQELESWRRGDGDTTFGGNVAFAGSKLVATDPGSVSGSAEGRLYFLDPSNGNELTSFNAPGSSNGDFFGDSLAADNTMVAVGSPGHDGAASNAGRTFLYSPLNHSLIGFIESPTPTIDGGFGASVALSPSLIIVGDNLDSVHAYDRTTRAHLWTRTAPPEAGLSSDYALSLAADDQFILVGAPSADTPARADAGMVEVLYPDGTVAATLLGPLLPQDGDGFGTSLRLHNDDAWVSIPFSEHTERQSRLEVFDLSGLNVVNFQTWFAMASGNLPAFDFNADGILDVLDYIEAHSPGFSNRFQLSPDTGSSGFWTFDLPDDLPDDVLIYLEESLNAQDWNSLFRYQGTGEAVGDPAFFDPTGPEARLLTPEPSSNIPRCFFRVRAQTAP